MLAILALAGCGGSATQAAEPIDAWDENRATVVLGDSEWMAANGDAYDAYPSCYGESPSATDNFGRTVYGRFRCVLTSPVDGSPLARVWITVTGASDFTVDELRTSPE